MTGQDLKNSILQLAIQGKLVPQDPNDEPASELLAKIRKEKERLVKEKKLKKKDLVTTPISDEDKPFEIPEGWEWCRLGEICSFLSRGKSPKYSDIPNLYPVFAQKCNLKTGGISLEQARFLNPDTIDKWQEIYKLKTGDILVNSTGTGTVCRTRLFHEKYLGHYPFTVPDSHVSVVRTFEEICSAFYYYIFNTKYIQDYWEERLAGSTNQKELYIGTLQDTSIPLPPLSEQHRIVAKIEEVMPLVEEYDKAQTKLDNLNSELPEQLKQSILQEAIMGKLGTQDPNDEPASELLKRIRKEKEQLVKEKKIKKEKALPEISDEEKPFDIPENWVWCRLGTILKPMESNKPSGEFFRYIDIDAIDNKLHIVNAPKVIAVKEAPSRASRKLHANDVLYSMVRPYLRNIAIIGDDQEDCIASTGFYVCSPMQGLCTSYLYYYLLSPYFTDGMHSLMKGDNSPSINSVDLQNYIIPLPPLSEQHRIVEKLELLLPKVNKLKQ